MPDVQTQEDDEYLCYSKPLKGEVYYITSFDPIYNPEATHHMILFGCDDPTYEGVAWPCAEHLPVCRDEAKIIFSWAMNAPSYQMPPDTSFKIGGKGFRNLVLQVHYKDASYFSQSPDRTDASGWKLGMLDYPTRFLSGIYIFIDSASSLPPKEKTLVAMACRYTGEVKLHPFAFRTHAHSHGLLNTAYVIHHGVKYLIGEKSPQKPQTFYPVLNKSLEVQPGDKLEASCLFNNNEDREIHMGHTRNDEMCNFYIMYSVPKEDAAQLDDPKNQNCLQSIDPKTGSRLASAPHSHHHGLKAVTEKLLEDLENEQEDMYFNPFGQILE
ncbi:hypothetical protein CRM22_005454 [Opisthorchis felineus]|uniref:peptidylglycine monooxygenase n=1 Tax=Opisthorchis felineus TaxID=147828 RepID=A0A4S2LQZ1_OPIFE|nr:hypothetical protein CRM22_005454 [Opisthorchis felineus]